MNSTPIIEVIMKVIYRLTLLFLCVGLFSPLPSSPATFSFLFPKHHFLSPPSYTILADNRETQRTLQEITDRIEKWNEIYPGDYLEFFLSKPKLTPEGFLKGLRSWELALEMGKLSEWREKGWLSEQEVAQAKQAAEFLRKVQEIISFKVAKASEIHPDLQMDLAGDEELKQYFDYNQPLGEQFASMEQEIKA